MFSRMKMMTSIKDYSDKIRHLKEVLEQADKDGFLLGTVKSTLPIR